MVYRIKTEMMTNMKILELFKRSSFCICGVDLVSNFTVVGDTNDAKREIVPVERERLNVEVIDGDEVVLLLLEVVVVDDAIFDIYIYMLIGYFLFFPLYRCGMISIFH